MRIQITTLLMTAFLVASGFEPAAAQTSATGRSSAARAVTRSTAASAFAARRLPSRRTNPPAPAKARPTGPPGDQIAASVRGLPRELNPTAEGASVDLITPDPNDPARDRILRLQQQLSEIMDGPIMSHVRLGMRVIDAATGRTFFRRGSSVMMDPASNQKVLATTAALMRLGSGFRFRTEVLGPPPDGNGVVHGDLVVRGNGDPSLRMVDIESLAAALAARGILRIEGAITGDPRRIGSLETNPDERTPLRVAREYVTVRVRPSLDGLPPLVSVKPDLEVLTVRNRAMTGRGRGGLRLNMTATSDRIIIELSGRISSHSPGLIMRRVAADQRIFTAGLLRRVLVESGIEVRDQPRVYEPRPPGDKPGRETILAVHRSEPLSVLVRRINKESDNEWADRLLDVVGAELFGGPATADKGLRAMREAMDELGLPRESYVPANGSGLGHANRMTADALAELLHKIYLDPRWGPEMLQSLSVGGVDGTTRNRFRGSPAAERVRVKTGTLSGKSALSGYVGDGHEVLVFSMFVDGIRDRRYTTMAVRNAQVSAVNAMMRFARGIVTEPPQDIEPGVDFEVGEEIVEADIEDKPAPGSVEAAAPARAPRPDSNVRPQASPRSEDRRERAPPPIEPEVEFSDEAPEDPPPPPPPRSASPRRGVGSGLSPASSRR
jgi:D-alanyl-D-alanine carboxypeptidase/D-alanyl-D-alanine-endopeptidase (penicillin-binding protein 4)